MSSLEPFARVRVLTKHESDTMVQDHEKRIAAVEELKETIDNIASVSGKAYAYLKKMTPYLIGALLASGVVTGPIGKALAFIAEHMQ